MTHSQTGNPAQGAEHTRGSDLATTHGILKFGSSFTKTAKGAALRELEHQVRHITAYVESQTSDEEVTHAERMMQTKVMGQEHEVWDVRTNKDRYWVVTNMTNLYSQEEFRSADYVLSFHLGLMLRLAERERSHPDPDLHEVSYLAWRKHEQAVDAFNAAGEAEEFQTVGVHCREALIAFALRLAEALNLDRTDLPKAADFKGWADIAADRWAPERRFRAYLKSLATHAWDLSVWLQHHGGAGPWDAEVVLDATKLALETFGLAHIRHDKGAPPRCPRCQSYRVESDGGIEHNEDPHIQWSEHVCGSCEHRWDHHYIRWSDDEGWVRTDWVPPDGM